MAKVRPGRRIERAGVNAIRSLLEEHDHLVQEIDGGADHGEDLFVSFVRDGRRTGHVIAIQVKSGTKYKRSNGYAIPVDGHADDWARSRLPVVGVVFDKEERRLFWVNLTKELQSGNTSAWIKVPNSSELGDRTIKGFVAELQQYVDVHGMRVKGTEAGGEFTERVRAARLGHGDLIDPDGGADLPNAAFAGIADFLDRHPRLRLDPRRALAYMLLILGMVVEWPLQNKFAAAYIPEIPSWLYVANMYGMIVTMMMIGVYEQKANRRAKGVKKFLYFVIWYYWIMIPLQMEMTDDPSSHQWWGKMYAWPMALLPNAVLVFSIAWYVSEEMDRRRRAASNA